jgi:glycerol kinase
MVRPQTKSIFLAAEGEITRFKTLVVDGGFSKNPVFMALLREVFPGMDIIAGQHAQGTAQGAALVMNAWPEHSTS